MTELEKQFAVNYYQWAKREFQGEVEGDFPILSQLRCSFSLRVYEFMLALPADRRRMFALARVKHSNPDAAELSAEPITEAERDLLQSYHNRSEVAYPIIGAIPYGGSSKIEREIEEAISKKELRAQHSNKVFRSAVLARVRAVLGGVPEVDQFETIKHVVQAEDWKITTSIALKGKFPMRYTQCLTSRRGLSLETSYHRWMGIMGDTLWDLITTDVTSNAIEQLVTLCARFISEGPRLLPNVSV
jgi:hypothetical protein